MKTPATRMRPLASYVLRAMRQWMIDSATTPEVIIDTTVDGVVIPTQYRKSAVLVLNVSEDASRGFEIGDEWVTMSTRFQGTPHHVRVPIGAVRGIKIRETGEFFPIVGEEPEGEETAQKTPKRPALRVVK